MSKENDQFQVWLMDMDDAIVRFISFLPEHIQHSLDYSPESLNVLEEWLLEKYNHVEETRPQSEAKVLDGAARYIGEVFRKRLGGKWKIDFSDSKNAFFGLPQLTDMVGQRVQVCPLSLVTTTTHRRTGNFLKVIFDNNARNAFSVKE